MILEWLILLLGIPTGYLIMWLAKDELAQGRKWFRVLIILSLISGIWFYLIGNKEIAFSSGFVFMVSLISFLSDSREKA